jgi:hypothetical protein
MKTDFEAVNLQLHVIHSFITSREGACDVCGLPGHLGGLMSVPGLLGHFCCIECVECRLFGPGRCRWCGFRLDPDQSAFCCDRCRAQNVTSPFGSGKRFALWLSRHEPLLFAELTGKEIPAGIACLECGDTLDGRRRGSRFCCPRCRKKFNLSPFNPDNTKQGDYPGHGPIVCVSAGTVAAGGVQSFHVGAD